MESQIHYQFADLEHLLTGNAVTDLQLDQELVKIKQAFPISLLEMIDEVQIRNYVRLHQYAVVRLMDRINTNGRPRRANTGYSKLEELLQFLASDFKSFYDFDAKAPEVQIDAARRDSKKHIRILKDLLTQKGVQAELINAVLHALLRIEKPYAGFQVTFQRILFAQRIQRTIYGLIENHQSDIREQLDAMLFYLNCNSIKVFLYQTQHFEKQVASETRAERIDKLALALKKVNQIQVKPGIGYNIHGTSLKELVSGFLNEEISYLERITASLGSGLGEDKMMQGFKLKVNLSVSQVAYVFRIFIENQLIQTQNQTELLRFLARVVVTKKAEHVSFDSLRAKYYNIESGTKESVKEALSTLVRYVDKT